MQDLTYRFALAVLVAAGLATAALQLVPAPAALGEPAALAAWQHRQFLQGLLGAGLVLAALVPALRLAAIGAGVLAKAGYVAIALTGPAQQQYAAAAAEGVLALLLLAAGWVLLRETRREARWDGVLPLRPEA